MTPFDIVDFWTRETPEARWFAVDDALDREIRRRFEAAWRAARDGAYAEWEATPEGALALLILLDQFPRNMFRGTADAFASDARARAIAKRAIARDFDLAAPQRVRQFFYLPLQHSENSADQDESVRLTEERLGKAHISYAYALRHRDTILRFGRFPARNKALGRDTTAAEAEFLAKNPAGF